MVENSKPKIAILTIKNSYNYGGVFSCLQQVYTFCQKYHFDPTIFCLSFDKKISTSLRRLKFSSSIKKSEYFGMNYTEIGAKWAFWEPGHYVFNLHHWQKALEDYDYFFVVSGNSFAAYPLIQLKKKFGMWIASPYEDDRVQRVNGLSGFRKAIYNLAYSKIIRIEKDIISKADFIWALSKYTANRFNQIIGQKRENMVICNYPMGIKLKSVDQKKNKNIIAVGRFNDPRKNLGMLIRVFDQLYKHNQSLKLYIVGSKPTNETLRKFPSVKSFNNIIFTGQVSSKELEKLYKQSDLMLITSHQEGLGIIGLEAMSYGIPVVSTKCGGTTDFIIDDFNGYLVDVSDDNDMVLKSLKILHDHNLAKKMSANALNYLETNFSVKKMESIFMYGLTKIYPELINLFEHKDINLNNILNSNIDYKKEHAQV